MDRNLLDLPPLDALRGFVCAARRMSISLAAEDLCLTQSAVSRQIQSVEESLGTPLFTRKHRALELTPAGEQLFQLASQWMNRLAEFAVAARGDVSKPVTVTAGIGFSSLWLVPRLGRFQEAHPDIDVRLAASNRLFDPRQEGIDLGIRYCREADAPPGAILLFDEKVVPVASPAIAKTAFKDRTALLKHVLLELEERARPWLRWSDWLHANSMANARPKGYLHFNQYDQLIQAAVEGQGVALGRVALVQPMLKDGRLVAQRGIEPGISEYGYWLWSPTETPRAAVASFRDWMIDEAKDHSRVRGRAGK
jgi:DNA-binding transcriptional LysR family regulator